MIDISPLTRVLRLDGGLVISQELPGLFTVRHKDYIFDWEEFDWTTRWIIDNRDNQANDRGWMVGKYYVHHDRINYIEDQHLCMEQLGMLYSLLPDVLPAKPSWFVEGRIIIV